MSTWQLICPTCGRPINAKTDTTSARFECVPCRWAARVEGLPKQTDVKTFDRVRSDTVELSPETTRAASYRSGRDSAGAPAGSLNLPATRNAVKERLS